MISSLLIGGRIPSGVRKCGVRGKTSAGAALQIGAPDGLQPVSKFWRSRTGAVALFFALALAAWLLVFAVVELVAQYLL